MSINLEEIVERAVPLSQGHYLGSYRRHHAVRAEDFNALVAEVERLREEVHTMRRWAEEAARAENLNALDAQKERASVLALLDRELEIAEAHDLLMGTLRVRQLRDVIARGEHRREEET